MPAKSTPTYLVPLSLIPDMTGFIIVCSISFIRVAFHRGDGENAPIPPVFGPVSPSPIRLWSQAAIRGDIVSPSVNAKTLISGPIMNSSMSTLFPDSPNLRSTKRSDNDFSTSFMFWHIYTPFPAASPSALITTGSPSLCTSFCA